MINIDSTPIFAGFSFAKGGFFNTLLAKSIRFFTGGDSNHAFLVYWDSNWNTWMTVGANVNGVTPIPMAVFLETHIITHLYEGKDFTLWDGCRAHVADLDKDYDFIGMVNMASVEIIEKIMRKPVANLLASKNRLYCSEWVSEIITSAIPPARMHEWRLGFLGYHDDIVDPALLQSELEQAHGLFLSIPTDTITRPWSNA